MQEVKVHRWCDVCNADNGARVEVTTRYQIALSVEGRTPLVRVLETCEIHSKPLEELRELLRIAGTAPKPLRDEAREVLRPTRDQARELLRQEQPELPIPTGTPRIDCPLCDSDFARTAIITHLIKAHGVKPLKQPAKCPECGVRKDKPSSMGMHRRVAHRYDHLADMLAQHEVRQRK